MWSMSDRNWGGVISLQEARKQTSEAPLVSDGWSCVELKADELCLSPPPPPLLAEHLHGGSGRFVLLCKAGVRRRPISASCLCSAL